MKVFRVAKYGSIDGMAEHEEEIPSPEHGQVLVRVRASSINFRDLVIIKGRYPVPLEEGRVPLSDAAGEIAAVGPGVTRFKQGDRVTNAFCPDWFGGPRRGHEKLYNVDVDGWLTHYKVVDAESLVALPDELSFEEGATLPCAAVTAWSSLKGIGAGDTVLTQGCGGVSLFALQLARAMGARVIATTSDAKKTKHLLGLGADHVIDYVQNPSWGEEARRLTKGRGVDRIVEVGGSGTLEQSIKAVAIGGQVSLVGILAGSEGKLDFMALFSSHATYQPIGTGSRADLEDLLRAIERHAIKPVLDSTFDWTNAKEALRHFERRQLMGKVVITHY